ncbi:copper amine oxidase N-terminal domain-containing protein [Dehalobacterium formicoaceticum]|uniref:Copper amine oxidase N-terminal domain-containing protein n=1 Tax=Dehalobacterium formicoaceticum TaxID=51515 RepID=A0ABT1Y3G8_9FIRM|nr:copper amine oxidase N-terminal domain-containing protein [Dehalobacterium formicoaceticum]MCR6545415.1 copper amine oxidase N-terminal domain-containing protein [Dehalobacterium formicoaceticum]
MITIRRLSFLFLAMFLLGFYFGPKVSANFLSPGSAEDPLVTQKWVDQYVAEAFSPIRERIASANLKLEGLGALITKIENRSRPTIILTVGSVKGFVDDLEYTLDAAPFIVSGRILLPLRFVGEAFGVDFAWDHNAKSVAYQSPEGKVILTIGEKTAQLGKNQVALDVSGTIVAGRTFVPLRFIGESLGAKVTWYGEKKQAVLK